MRKVLRILFFAAAIVVAPAAVQASPFSFTAIINTAPLVGSGQGPFALDFQLTGLGPATNTVILSNFQFGGGFPSSIPSDLTLIGGANGSLSTSVTLSTAGGFFNEFFQVFTPGALIRFDVLFPSVNVNIAVPDAFSISILDGNLLNLVTTGQGNTLMFLNLNKPGLAFADIQKGQSVGPSPAGVTATAVPEPATLLFVGAGLAVLGRVVAGRPRSLRR